ncbi:MAG: aminotransferase class V-fold PLP-dependent enzyme [Acidobacteria bacterium]|nr:aminotransferase class V-fold PLP-dependent enzyme [Acidobacteriota bacterium]
MSLDLAADEFRRLAAEAVRIAAEYLESLPSRPSFPPHLAGRELAAALGEPLPEAGCGVAALDAVARLFDSSRPNSPRFFAYVMGSGEPVAAAGDLLASVLNQNVTSWRSAPAAATIERLVIGWLGEAIGCPGFSGSLTGGGSAANLMALAMARESRAPANTGGAQPAVVYCSAEAHMSIAKAMALLGLGRGNLRSIPVDAQFRMEPAALEEAIREDGSAGRRAIAVIATAGTVNTGALDPLIEIAAIARRHDLWLHVDGAYGALAAIADAERFAGMAQADSITLDPHKWLYQPLDCGCVLYRDPAAARAAFAGTGDYARSLYDGAVEGFEFFEESPELSRRFRALKLWLSLRYHGLGAFREAIVRDLQHAQDLAGMVDAEPALERVAPVELSTVCFRYAGADDDRNRAILRRVIERGRVYLSNATIASRGVSNGDGRFALRACFMNHRTKNEDVTAVVEEVLAAAEETGA